MSKAQQFMEDFEKIKALPSRVYLYKPTFDEQQNVLTISNKRHISKSYIFAYLFLAILITVIWIFVLKQNVPVLVFVLWLLFFLAIFYFSYKKALVDLNFNFNDKTLLDKRDIFRLADLVVIKSVVVNRKTQVCAAVLEFPKTKKYNVVFKGSEQQCVQYVKNLKKLLQ